MHECKHMQKVATSIANNMGFLILLITPIPYYRADINILNVFLF